MGCGIRRSLWGFVLAPVCAVGFWVLVPLAGQAQSLPSPDTPESHLSYLEAVANAKDTVFNELLARYDAFRLEAPDSVTAAIERCSYIAGSDVLNEEYVSDDETWEERNDLLNECLAELQEQFATHPDAVVYRLEQKWGDEAIAFGDEVLSGMATDWSPADRGRTRMVLARKIAYADPGRAAREARRAMQENPDLDGSVVVAKDLIASGREAEAIEVLRSRLLQEDVVGDVSAKARLLADLEEYEAAEEAMVRANEISDGYVDEMLQARVLEGLGRTDEARELYLAQSEWYARTEALTRLFEIDLAREAYESAFESYQLLRDESYWNDPFLRNRVRLALAYPSAPWARRDLLGVFGLVGLILLCVLIPTLCFIPIHYAGLIRRESGHSPPTDLRWSLRSAWLVAAVLLTADTLCLLVFLPDELDAWFQDYAVEMVYDSTALARYGVVATVITFVLVAAFLRRRDVWFVFRSGWPRSKTAIQVFKAFLVLLVVASINYSIAVRLGWSEAVVGNDPAVAANFVELMLQAILREYGAAALIVVGAVLVPVTEEVVFRYILLEGFRSQVPLRWANGLQALFFALAHENLAFVPFFTLFGFVAGKLRLDSRSLLPSILLHASWNLFICLRLIALT